MHAASPQFRVLVADDNPGDIELLTEAVRSATAPIELVVKATAVQAWAWLEDGHDVDLVITDQNMPGMSGVELVGRMRRDFRLAVIPVIITSSTPELLVPEPTLDSGAPFIPKAHSWGGYLRLVRELVAALTESPVRPSAKVATRVAMVYRSSLPSA